MDDTLVNLALIGIGILAAFAGLLRGAATLTAWVSRTSQPTADWAAGIRVLSNPGDPSRVFGAAISPWVYWPIVAVLVLALGVAGFLIWRTVDSMRHSTRHDPRRLAGVATRAEVAAVASKKALLARSATLRPSLTNAAPTDVGYLNRPGKSGDSIRWEGWSHVREYVEEVSGRAA
jgi:type IV secretion system protein VirD4